MITISSENKININIWNTITGNKQNIYFAQFYLKKVNLNNTNLKTKIRIYRSNAVEILST